MITLQPITKHNWIDAISLKVKDIQKNFVASNAVSLAQYNFLNNFHAMGIYNDETMVGFALFGIDEDDGEYWIYRLMIDEKYQGLGYGKEAIKLIIQHINNERTPRHQSITISYEKENEHALSIYKKLGFKEIDGLVIEGELVARYIFDEKKLEE